mgnify:CR=1 FL=1
MKPETLERIGVEDILLEKFEKIIYIAVKTNKHLYNLSHYHVTHEDEDGNEYNENGKPL